VTISKPDRFFSSERRDNPGIIEAEGSTHLTVRKSLVVSISQRSETETQQLGLECQNFNPCDLRAASSKASPG
jgi:hypothetical protein